MSPQTIVRAITLTGAIWLFSAPVYSQGRGGTPPGAASPGSGATTTTPGSGTTSTTTTTPNPGRTTIPTTPSPTQQPTMAPPPIFISGRVMLEDGTAPPSGVVMERVCGGSTHAEGYADSNGYFSVELGRSNNGVMQDASEGGGNMRDFGSGGMADTGGFGNLGGGRMSPLGSDMRFQNCELQARLAGYRSQSVSLVNRRSMDNPDVGVILLHRLGPNEGTIVSANSLAAPKNARKAYDKGMDALKKRKPADAGKEFQKAVELYPEYAAAWYEMGRLQVAQQDRENARKSFDAAVKADPKYVSPLVEIAFLEAQAQNWKDLAETTDKAARLDSFDYPQVFLLNAVANYNLHNIEAAEKSARQAAKLDTRHQYPKSAHLMGIILAQRQDYQGAAEQFRTYLKFAPSASDASAVRSQLENIEKMTAQTAPAPDKQ
jgi:tetratricopeptide (TPR) repeat protein